MTDQSLNLDDLVLKIHSAPLEPEGWRVIVDDLRHLLRAERGLLHIAHPQSADDSWSVPVGFDQACLEAYASEWAAQDVWAQGAARNCRTQTGLVDLTRFGGRVVVTV